MVRKKKNKALFEVLSQGRGIVEVPGWIKDKPENQADSSPDKELEIPRAEPAEAAEPIAEENEDQSAAKTIETQPLAAEEDATENVATDDADDEVAEIIEDVEESETFPNAEADEAEAGEAEAGEAEADEAEADDESQESDGDTGEFSSAGYELPYVIPRDVPDLPARQGEPLMQVDEGRIRISMTRVGAMVALGAVLVLLVAAFAVGLTAGKSRSPAPRQQQLPPKAGNLHIGGTRIGSAHTDNDHGVLVEAGTRTAGRYYLVFGKLDGTGDTDRVDASNIMALFGERGYPSQLVKINKKGDADRWAIWGRHGFENPDSTAGRQYANAVKRVGEEYFKKYGKYKFQNPYFLKKLKK